MSGWADNPWIVYPGTVVFIANSLLWFLYTERSIEREMRDQENDPWLSDLIDEWESEDRARRHEAIREGRPMR